MTRRKRCGVPGRLNGQSDAAEEGNRGEVEGGEDVMTAGRISRDAVSAAAGARMRGRADTSALPPRGRRPRSLALRDALQRDDRRVLSGAESLVDQRELSSEP